MSKNSEKAKLYAVQATRCLIDGKLDEAVAYLRESIALEPGLVEAHTNLGVALFQQGKIDESVAAYSAALRHKPDYSLAYVKLGQALHAQGKTAAALDAYRQAIARGNDTFDLHAQFGIALQSTGQLGEALTHLRRSVDLKPGSAPAVLALVDALMRSGQGREALAAAQRLVDLRPESAEAHIALANVLLLQDRPADAATCCMRAIELQPNSPIAHAVLGNALQKQGKIVEALSAWQKALTLAPDLAEVHFNVGSALRWQARFEEAVASYRRAIELKPDFYAAYSARIFTMVTAQMAPADALIALVKQYGQLFPPDRVVTPPVPREVRGQKLNIGIVTAELSGHAVSCFLSTYLRHYDRTRFHLTLYLTVARNDEPARELAAIVDQVRNVADMSDAEARDCIRRDHLDLLVETSAHTHNGRLPILAHRCAPVQCHYIGYHGTTGLPAIDYFIGDDEITPPAFDSQFTERIYRLPRLWIAYTPHGPAPPPKRRLADGNIVLGSFNTLSKVRGETLALWAYVLNRLPGARLLVKDSLCAYAFTRDRLFRALAEKGISGDRIDLMESTPSWYDHMSVYNEVDIALDALPQSSSTTAFDAIYMGTPLVAFRGAWIGARMSSSIVKSLGYPQWVAQTTDDYAKIVTALASNKEQLGVYKETLRAEMLSSALCDGKSLAAALETAFEHMIQSRYAGREIAERCETTN